MHEMSIVMNIIEIASAEARRAKAKVINSIEVDLGRLAGVEIDSLEFCFQIACAKTSLAGAQLLINDIPGRGYCPACKTLHEIELFVAICPTCDTPLEIRTGRELKVHSISVD